LYRAGAVNELVKDLERYKIDVLCMKLDGQEKERIKKGIMWFYVVDIK